MPPEETSERAVGVVLVVRMVMMPAMDRGPMRRRVLQTRCADDGKRAFKPSRTGESAMRYHSVISEIDADHAKDKIPQKQKNNAGPTKEPRQQRQCRDDMANKKPAGFQIFYSDGILRLRQRNTAHDCIFLQSRDRGYIIIATE